LVPLVSSLLAMFSAPFGVFVLLTLYIYVVPALVSTPKRRKCE